jgi:hypothetical protein
MAPKQTMEVPQEKKQGQTLLQKMTKSEPVKM